MDWYKMGEVYGERIRRLRLVGPENTKAMTDMIMAFTSKGSQPVDDILTFSDGFIKALQAPEDTGEEILVLQTWDLVNLRVGLKTLLGKPYTAFGPYETKTLIPESALYKTQNELYTYVVFVCDGTEPQALRNAIAPYVRLTGRMPRIIKTNAYWDEDTNLWKLPSWRSVDWFTEF